MKKKYYILIILGITLIGSILLFIFSSNKKYTVTFDTAGGRLLNTVYIKKGDTIKNIKKPVKDGYLFVYWLLNGVPFDEDTPITKDITLKAKWTVEPILDKKYKVSFVVDDKTKTKTVKEGDMVEKSKDPTKVNYKFLGWYDGDNLFDFQTKVKSDIVLTAKFEKILVTVNFDLDGGDGTKSLDVTRGDKLIKPKDPTKFGYRFIKWTLNGEDYDFNSVVNDDMTLMAKWVAIEYVKVKFDTDGGTEITSQTIEKGTKLQNVKMPVKDGYTFKYWSLNGEPFDVYSVINDNYTLVAVYEEN